ncbi:MAG: hypothetical protein ABJF88_08475 [Rhodothermales bacterium]
MREGLAVINPTFLIASAINTDGQVELPAVREAIPSALARALFEVDPAGGFVQQVVPRTAKVLAFPGKWRPLDMTFFARCLCCQFGVLTPELFAIRGHPTTGGLRGRLLHTDPTSEEVRRRTLRSAFLIHLSAYEERLI